MSREPGQFPFNTDMNCYALVCALFVGIALHILCKLSDYSRAWRENA